MPPADPLPNDEPSATHGAPMLPPGLESLRTIYDRRRRRLRFALILGLVLLVAMLGVATWLFIRYPLRAMRQHGRTVEVREMIGQAAEKIRAGDDTAAADVMRKRLALIDRDLEPLLWVRTARMLTGLYISTKRFDDARAILDEALPWAEKHPMFGVNAAETLKLLHKLATLESEQGHDEAAETLFRQILERSERALGADNLDTLMSLNNYGWFLVGRSRLDEAEPLLLRCTDGLEKAGWANTSSMAAALDSVAHLRDKQGRLSEAVELQRQAVKITRQNSSEQSSDFKEIAGYLAELEARTQAGPTQK